MTWSPSTRRFFEAYGEVLRKRPAQQWVRGCAPYGLTYTLALASAPSQRFRDEVLALARSLLALRVRSRIMLLRDLLAADVDRACVHGFLAWTRGALVALQGDRRAALYTPPSPDRSSDNEFLLHADLFAAERVLLVFDDVPCDGSGRALLLPIARAASALAKTSMPAKERRVALGLVSGAWVRDAFDRLHSLLYGTRRRWHREVAKRLNAEAVSVPFERGEGYLLHDRQWLHGRERVTGPVRIFRFHRLIHSLPRLHPRLYPGVGRVRLACP